MKSIRFFFLLALPMIGFTQATPATPPTQESPAAPLSNQEYNIETPYGEQPLPVNFTKELTFDIGTLQLGFYGFIKADYVGINKISGSTADVLPNNVPFSNNLADQHTESLLDARNSRLGMKVEDKIKNILLKGVVEVDFNTQSNTSFAGNAISFNAHLCRLRHAYCAAELPSHFFFLAGQYFAILEKDPEIPMPTRVNIIHYPPGAMDARYPQFRFGFKHYKTKTALWQIEAGAENQGYNDAIHFTTPAGGLITQATEQKWPFFAAKLSYLSDSLKIQCGGGATQIYAIVNSLGTRVHTPAWGLITNGSYTWKNLILWGTYHYFVGLQGQPSNYINGITLITRTVGPQTRYSLQANRSNGWSLALRYDFIKGALWTDVMYGVEHGIEIAGPGSSLSGTNFKYNAGFRANLIGAFWKHWQLGIEYERDYLRAYNDLSGSMDMIHIGFWYIFGKP